MSSRGRIAEKFRELHDRRRKALVLYATAGHPDRSRSLELLRGLEDAGADIMEVGVPFSDPLADGPVIQASSQSALDAGMSLDSTLDLVAEANLGIPVVLFTYLNPLLSGGPDILDRIAGAGCSGLLVTDLPLGGDEDLETRIGSSELAFVRLVAPTTPDDRIAAIGRAGSGFVYVISRLGVTGVQANVSDTLASTVARVRAATSLPICAGFGVGTPEQARTFAAVADGVVVGSAIVRAAGSSVGAAVSLATSLRAAIDEVQ